MNMSDTSSPGPLRILLLGQGGQVGWELQRALRPLGQLIGLDFNTPGPAEAPDLKADFSQPEQVAAIVRAVRPDVIVNAAAHTAVDKAESEPELARLINATTPGLIAQEAATLGALLVHYSTDYVFDGSGSAPRDETAPTAPLSVYGQTKLEAEQAIAASGCRHLIFRTSWVYAARGGNFAKTMLRLASERDQLKVIDDQFGAPTGADLLADVTAHAIRATLARPQLAGLYHLIAGGETHWHAYARFVIEWARANGVPIQVAPDAILPVPTTAYPTPARRPLNSRLSTLKLQQAFGLTLPHWQVGVERMLTEIHGK
jgi:dTDP-4-dehydrorhamnose reductase